MEQLIVASSECTCIKTNAVFWLCLNCKYKGLVFCVECDSVHTDKLLESFLDEINSITDAPIDQTNFGSLFVINQARTVAFVREKFIIETSLKATPCVLASLEYKKLVLENMPLRLTAISSRGLYNQRTLLFQITIGLFGGFPDIIEAISNDYRLIQFIDTPRNQTEAIDFIQKLFQFIDLGKSIQFLNTRRNSFTITDISAIISNKEKKIYIFTQLMNTWVNFDIFQKSCLQYSSRYVPTIGIKPTMWKRFENMSFRFREMTPKRKFDELY